MKILFLDCETSTHNEGNPFDPRNFVKVVGIRFSSDIMVFDLGVGLEPTRIRIMEIQTLLDQADFVVGFNLKFDIHHLRRLGIIIRCPIWDCQYAEFLLGGQEDPKISLESACQKRGLGEKVQIDWTKEPTLEELVARVSGDVELTEKLFYAQKKVLEDKPQLKRLAWFGSQDILVTEEMEWNGLKYDLELSKELGNKLVTDIQGIDSKLQVLFPYSFLDFGNHWHISPILYGGTVAYQARVVKNRILKSGKETFREVWQKQEVKFPKIVEPLKGSNLKPPKDTYYKTDEKTLRSLRSEGTAKVAIGLLLERAKLDKKVSTYFHGIPKLYDEMHWSEGILHGQLIHVRAITGRLSSKAPNQQNLDEEVRKCITTRFQRR